MSKWGLEVLGRREDQNTEYSLAEAGSKVSNITGEEMRGSRRDKLHHRLQELPLSGSG
jgi:hypothetical protein